MGLFNVFISPDPTAIPTFDPSIDSINLQIKSLLYLFKRLRIKKLASLVGQDGKLKYADTEVVVVFDNDPTFTKLDKTYNVAKFEAILLDDEYRVVVDFIKNKFRAMCFINEVPVNLSRPGSPVRDQSTNTGSDKDEFPPFLDYKERKSKLFEFTLFPISQHHTMESIASILSGSKIYIEHKVPFLKRYNIALAAIAKVMCTSPNAKFIINQDKKSKIIRNYLVLLATHVQVMRIYDEYTKLHPLVASPTKSLNHSVSKLSLGNSSVASSPSSSPTKPHTKSPVKLSAKPARRDSQTLLRTKPSISQLKLDELYNPVANPPLLQPDDKKSGPKTNNGVGTGAGVGSRSGSEPGASSGSVTLLEDTEGREILRLDVYERCKVAINDRIKSERKKLAKSQASS
ncbi:hypothetical protein CANMA_001481 [Candida margitis]|uniref:uncharacterized protein n=1 Tax=Candida margitis TaxID=1775924 RepID=UPI0022276EA0|nr:uncharacterized protein CANMA_001481 [Candida margitis]KAI5969414.1 hypothetical protein CANMA_001481 [Candida margitis]